jgi:glycosyltransferase involved in cell wall biosynthesis
MKIALIGNMNNNNFALMRYFRDLGVDARLLLYANDGFGVLGHFTPESDTWDIERWRPYIHQTTIPNTPIAGLDAPWSWVLAVRSWMRVILKKQDFIDFPVSKAHIREAYAGYDKLVASGISPATLHRAGLRLDLFYPYSNGVEFVHAHKFAGQVHNASILERPFLQRIALRQAAGIQNSRMVVTCESGLTQEALEKMGIHAPTLTIPMVYSNEELPVHAPNETLRVASEAIDHSRLTILHQARLMFQKPSELDASEWVQQSKNNHWLLRAFARLVSERPHLNPLLLMVAYGQDVDATERLAKELGIDQNIHWLPVMQRRELMWLMPRVTIGCGEFYDVPRMIWGGTGWEALAGGRPLLQGFNFAEGEFAQIYGYPPPPMLPVRKPEDIEARLLDVADQPEKAEQIGRAGLAWFHQHNGVNLAKNWLGLLSEDAFDNKVVIANG